MEQWADSSSPRGAVKNLERIKKSREAVLKKLTDDSKKDNVLIFENLGVDYLFVDEADAYKNLFLYSKMNNVAGISNAASQRASDLQMKIEYINELHGGDKGVVFATGTPISNSMAEMYTLQTYLQKNTLRNLGINFFDGWAADFGETVTSLELAPSGQGYRARTRFAKFTNLPELLTLYRTFADVQTSDMVKLDVPEAVRKVVTIKPSDEVIELTQQIAERAEKIYGGGVDPHVDNMLKITSDGKKIALDPRCYDSAMSDSDVSKLNECANEIMEYYNESKGIRGTQLVFCDLSTPKKSFSDYEYGKDFDAYNDLKYKLVQRGIPAEEIVFIHEANTDQQKQALFNKVNEGTVRVLIGSTEKCGAGTNVQKRLYALHHLDAPYRPRDLIQRDGRGIRQGNLNDIHVYSIDEVFIDATNYLAMYKKTPHEFALMLVREVMKKTGITATAGIGSNLYLCKVAMDIVAKHIPADKDGVRIAELDEMSYREKLWGHQPITDFWRVGQGYAKRLEKYGIYTMGDIALCSTETNPYFNEDVLYKEFGINAELLIDHAWGWESCTIADIKAYKPESTSMTIGQVLTCPYDFEKGGLIVREMAEQLSLDLVAKRLVTDQIVLTVGYDIENKNYGSVN